jgi:hypothetical protein
MPESVIDQRLRVGTDIVSGQSGPRDEVRVASASGTSDEKSLRDEAIELIQRPWLGQPCEQGVITRSNAIVHCKPLAYHIEWIVRPAIREDPTAA